MFTREFAGITAYRTEASFSGSIFFGCVKKVQYIGYYSLIAYLLGFQRRGGTA